MGSRSLLDFCAFHHFLDVPEGGLFAVVEIDDGGVGILFVVPDRLQQTLPGLAPNPVRGFPVDVVTSSSQAVGHPSRTSLGLRALDPPRPVREQ